MPMSKLGNIRNGDIRRGILVAVQAITLETSAAEVKKTRVLPYVMTCAFKYKWSTSSARITYDSLLSDYKNSGKFVLYVIWIIFI